MPPAQRYFNTGTMQTFGIMFTILGSVAIGILVTFEPTFETPNWWASLVATFLIVGPMLVTLGVGLIAVASSFPKVKDLPSDHQASKSPDTI